jgi:hypothetical protein
METKALKTFNQRADDCALLLERISDAISDRRADAKEDPENESHARSMTEVRNKLRAVLDLMVS